MKRVVTKETLEAAVVAGLLLSAGGSGRASAARHRRIGELALGYGSITINSIRDLDDDAQIIVATGVGAPGHVPKSVEPHDSVEAARLLVKMSECVPAGVMPGHVPGLYSWLQAVLLGVPVIDAAANGRGHPTVKMGGMGMASRPDLPIMQVGCGGNATDGSLLRVIAEGSIVKTSNIMRQAAIQNGGLIMAARGPLSAAFVRANGALGAFSFQIGLGEAMLHVPDGERRIHSVVEFTKGRLLGIGRVIENTVRYSDGFDIGGVIVEGKREIKLAVYNEYMAADIDDERVATFPDFIGTMDPRTGDPLAISELVPGEEVAVVAASKRNFPLGAGVWDPAVYPEVEERMGVDLARFALNPEA